MKLRVLGCSGGIGGKLRTTSLLLDDDVLIDAGTGVGDLSMEAMAKIEQGMKDADKVIHVETIPEEKIKPTDNKNNADPIV